MSQFKASTMIVLLMLVLNGSATAQKFPSCTTPDAQARTKVAVREWFQALMSEANKETGKSGQLLDVEISFPWAENAYPGKYAGVVKCSVKGYATIRTWDNRIGRIPLQQVMVYYSYDKDGNFIVTAQPDKY